MPANLLQSYGNHGLKFSSPNLNMLIFHHKRLNDHMVSHGIHLSFVFGGAGVHPFIVPAISGSELSENLGDWDW